MATRVKLHLLKVGSCTHCERVTIKGGKLRSISFPSLATLIIHPAIGPILMDTGYAAHFENATAAFPERLYRWVTPMHLPEQQTLEKQLNRFGYGAGDIKICVISHFHADHIAGLHDLPNARFIALKAAYEEIIQTGRIQGLMHGLLKSLLPENFHQRLQFADKALSKNLPSAFQGFEYGFDLLGDGSVIGIPLPGHAQGQLGILMTNEDGQEIFFCADACWSELAFRELRMPAIVTRPLMHNWLQYRDTMTRLHLLSKHHSELKILPSHCSESLGRFQKNWDIQ